MHPTLPELVLRQVLTHQALQPGGAEVPPEHGSVLGGEQPGSHPKVPSQQIQAQLGGGHPVITISHEVSQVRVEKLKGEQFYNLEETGNTLNDTNIKMLRVAVRIYSQRTQQASPEHSPLLMYSRAWCLTAAPSSDTNPIIKIHYHGYSSSLNTVPGQQIVFQIASVGFLFIAFTHFAFKVTFH